MKEKEREGKEREGEKEGREEEVWEGRERWRRERKKGKVTGKKSASQQRYLQNS